MTNKPPQSSGGGQNQTLLELIYSLKGLAQTVEFFHQDISRKLDEESKARTRELDRLRDLLGKNSQTLSVLPITLSDRVEKLVGNLKTDIGKQLSEVNTTIGDVQSKLYEYAKVTDRAVSQNEATVEALKDDRADITGRIEVANDGRVKIQVNSAILKKIWYAIVVLAAGGGAYGLKEAVSSLLEK